MCSRLVSTAIGRCGRWFAASTCDHAPGAVFASASRASMWMVIHWQMSWAVETMPPIAEKAPGRVGVSLCALPSRSMRRPGTRSGKSATSKPVRGICRGPVTSVVTISGNVRSVTDSAARPRSA
ncbi:Uncharacterised protein [Mycobacteroides abscessus subsp. abscessus]|nr:Uncharacterised protein [Mycobacteroides abscessus subsp. abscessus]